MEPNTKRTSDQAGAKLADKVSTTIHSVREQVEERGPEIIDQAKQKVGEVYEEANKRVSEQYGKAIDYGRENPGKSTLLIFGVGVGVGLLLSSFGGSRSRGNRMVEPIMSALSTMAGELFR